jgi:general secretion pathway protein L
MSAAQTVVDGFWRWLDHVADAIIAIHARVAAQRAVRLVETQSGQFLIYALDRRSSTSNSAVGAVRLENGQIVGQKDEVKAALRGGRIDLVFQAERFLFKPLELPSRAADFLDGVVRAHIDRLTPWKAENAAFGCSEPVEAGSGRIAVTVAAISKAAIAPYLQAFSQMGVRSVEISTNSPEAAPDTPAIKISERSLAESQEKHRTRRILAMVLAGGCLVAAASVIASSIIGSSLEARQDEVAHRISVRRASLVAARNSPGDPITVAQRALARRKNETPSSVIALEILSQIIPDNTYVTELRIEENKLRLSGVSQDAPALIRLIEQSRHFSSATFFAPTTRGASDKGDRFNIEARIEPIFQVQP